MAMTKAKRVLLTVALVWLVALVVAIFFSITA
jgi:hypothetical protein